MKQRIWPDVVGTLTSPELIGPSMVAAASQEYQTHLNLPAGRGTENWIPRLVLGLPTVPYLGARQFLCGSRAIKWPQVQNECLLQRLISESVADLHFTYFKNRRSAGSGMELGVAESPFFSTLGCDPVSTPLWLLVARTLGAERRNSLGLAWGRLAGT